MIIMNMIRKMRKDCIQLIVKDLLTFITTSSIDFKVTLYVTFLIYMDIFAVIILFNSAYSFLQINYNIINVIARIKKDDMKRNWKIF